MNKRLLSYAKLLKERLLDAGCTFNIQKQSEFGVIQEYCRNGIDSKIIEHTVNSMSCQYRLELGKDIIKLFLYMEKDI